MSNIMVIDNATVYTGDAITCLQQLPEACIQCCVTSPPYYGLRSYNTDPQIWGGEPECNHAWTPVIKPSSSGGNNGSKLDGGKNTQLNSATKSFQSSSICQSCGAWLGELGLEPDPQLYIDHLTAVFREVRRVLKDNGTLWIVIGDSYAGSWGSMSHDPKRNIGARRCGINGRPVTSYKFEGIKPKDLIGIPWMLAFTLRSDGWYLRSEVIWHKLNPMPESVTDRPTRSHEQIFLLSKGRRYYYDAKSIAEDFETYPQREREKYKESYNSSYLKNRFSTGKRSFYEKGQKNKRSVWSIPTYSYQGAHFAVYPPALIEPCILAGSKEGDTILDPFFGSGTTGEVALKYGRKVIGIELNSEYKALWMARIKKAQRQIRLVG